MNLQAIQYGQRSARVRRMLASRTSWIVGACVLGAAVCWVAWKAYLEEPVMASYWRHRWLTFSESPTRVVFSNDPAVTSGLREPDYEIFWSKSRTAYRLPRAFRELGPYLGPSGVEAGIFLHSRVPDGGKKAYVVFVYLDIDTDFRGGGRLCFVGGAFVPSRPADGPVAYGPRSWMPFADGERLTIFAGQPDPRDASHFTIEYSVAGDRGEIDGHLDQHGVVQLAVHGPPLQFHQVK